MSRYAGWFERTLTAETLGESEGEELALLVRTADAIRQGQSTFFGATIPSEEHAAFGAAVLPRLDAKIDAFRARGVVLVAPDPPKPSWKRISKEGLKASMNMRAVASWSEFPPVASPPVGGLLAVGFVPGTELLLVCSSRGRGLFDCTTGERIARDVNERGEIHGYPEFALGIGPADGVVVTLTGIVLAPPLRCATSDGWRLGANEEHGFVWLAPPGEEVDPPGPRAERLAYTLEEMHAGGFSESGRCLVFAEQHTVHLFARE